MPIQLADLQRDAQQCPVEYEGLILAITYRPSAYTAETESRWQEMQQNGRPVTGLAEMLADILIAWDIFDGDAPLPITRETLRGLGAPVLGAIINAINADSAPKGRRSPNSGGGSLRGDR